MNAEELIEFFGMEPLPEEGGYYVETYRAAERIGRSCLPGRYGGERCFGTAIFYLLTANSFSALHRLKSDEVFHFYMGDAVEMLQLHPDGSSSVITLGSDVAAGQRVQVVVPAMAWQGSQLKQGGAFALLGCTVAPGFERADYEQADRAELLERYPERRGLILRLSRE